MADKDITIGIKTTGTEAAAAEVENVSRELRGLAGAGTQDPVDLGGLAGSEELKTSAEAFDETAAAVENLGEKTEDAAPKVSRLALSLGVGGIVSAAAAAGQVLGDIYEALNKVDTVELRRLDEKMANQIEQAKEWGKALKNPIEALLKFATGDTVESAWAEADAQLKLNAEARQAYNDQIIARGNENAAKLEKLLERLEFINKRTSALGAADDARKDREAAAATAADPKKAPVLEAENINREAVNNIRSLSDSIIPLEAKAKSAKEALDAALDAELKIQARVQAGEATNEDLEKARKQSADLFEKVSTINSEISEQKEIIAARISEISDRAGQSIDKLANDSGLAITQAAKDAIAAIQDNAKDQGRAPNFGEQETISRIQGLVEDTTPDAQQGGDLAAAIQSLQNNLTAKDATLSEGLEKLRDEAKAQNELFVRLLQTLQIKPEETQKVTKAAEAVSSSIRAQGEATITGFVRVKNVTDAITQRLAAMQNQINALQAAK